MEVTLSNGVNFEIKALTLAQVERCLALTGEGKAVQATVQACVDAMNRSGAQTTVEDLKELLTIEEFNELFKHVAEVSGLRMGELKASA